MMYLLCYYNDTKATNTIIGYHIILFETTVATLGRYLQISYTSISSVYQSIRQEVSFAPQFYYPLHIARYVFSITSLKFHANTNKTLLSKDKK